MIQRIVFCCAILMLCTLQGCVYQTLSVSDIKRGEAICTKLGLDVREMTSSFTGDESVTCSNGTSYFLWGDTSRNILGDG